MKSIILFLILSISVLAQNANTRFVNAANSSTIQNGETWGSAWSGFDKFDVKDLPNPCTLKVAPGTYQQGSYAQSGDIKAVIHIKGNHNLIIIKGHPDIWDADNDDIIFRQQGDYNCGILIYPGSGETIDNIQINDIKFENFRNAIRVSGFDFSNYVSNVLISNCNILTRSGQKSIRCERAEGITIEKTKIDSFADIQIENDGIYMQAVNDVTIRENIIFVENNYSDSNPPHIDCIQITKGENDEVDIYSRDITIESNYCVNNSDHFFDDRQGIHITYTSGDILVANNIIKSKKGDGLLNLFFNYDTGNFRVYNNTLYAGGDQRSVMSIVYYPTAAMIPIGPDLVEIKNNIIYKADSSSKIMAKFVNIPEKGMDGELYLNNSILNNNLYFIGDNPQNPYQTGFADYDGSNYTNERYNVWNDNWEANGIAANPLFLANDTTLKVDYKSPAKNRGIGFYNNGIVSDWHGNMRPYWNRDFDIGAYEIEDTQLKIGVTGYEGEEPITHYLTSFGTYWERTGTSYSLSTVPGLSTAAITYDQPDDDVNKLYEWEGLEYNWMDWSNNSSGKRIAAGFYKVSNNRSSAYFYLDLRDAVTGYSLNAFILYNHNVPQYLYRDGITGSFKVILSGEVIRIWDINNDGNHNTSGLGSQYWSNCLIPLSENNHPKLVWGPYQSGQQWTYTVYWKGPADWVQQGNQLNYSVLEYTDTYREITSSGGNIENYKVVVGPVNLNSNIVDYRIDGDPYKAAAKYIAEYKYSISQNYPNPFNPLTSISFSLAEKQYVTLKIYDITGREIKTLVNGEYEIGIHIVEFDGSELSSGVYFYQIIAADFRETKKLQILK